MFSNKVRILTLALATCFAGSAFAATDSNTFNDMVTRTSGAIVAG